VDLALVSFLHKIWEMLAGETILRNFRHAVFFHTLTGSRELIVTALTKGIQHEWYIPLFVPTLFPSDLGDPELVSLMSNFRASRIRELTVRALVATMP
jgi:hypothetical protein